MNVLVIAPSLKDTSPGSRFRIEQWMPLLEREGVRFTYAAFEDRALHEIIYTRGNKLRKAALILRAYSRRLGLLPSVREYDLVFLYEEAARIGPALIERVIHRLGVPILYDFCDPIWVPYKSPTNHYLSYLKFFGKTATICRMSDHILVGNPDIAAYARQYNENVTIVPITIDLRLYTERAWPEAPPAVPVVGWSGSHSSVRCLDELRGVWGPLAQRHPFTLEVIGADRYEVGEVATTVRPWRSETEIADLQRFDIGLMPLPMDDRWIRLRSHLKLRQYMALGIPCVASPVGVITDLIEDGVSGFLATTKEEWIDKISRLLTDEPLRRRMGAAGRRSIEKHCDAAVWARKVHEIMKRAVRRERA